MAAPGHGRDLAGPEVRPHLRHRERVLAAQPLPLDPVDPGEVGAEHLEVRVPVRRLHDDPRLGLSPPDLEDRAHRAGAAVPVLELLAVEGPREVEVAVDPVGERPLVEAARQDERHRVAEAARVVEEPHRQGPALAERRVPDGEHRAGAGRWVPGEEVRCRRTAGCRGSTSIPEPAVRRQVPEERTGPGTGLDHQREPVEVEQRRRVVHALDGQRGGGEERLAPTVRFTSALPEQQPLRADQCGVDVRLGRATGADLVVRRGTGGRRPGPATAPARPSGRRQASGGRRRPGRAWASASRSS